MKDFSVKNFSLPDSISREIAEKEKIAAWVEELKSMPELRDISEERELGTLTTQNLQATIKKLIDTEASF